MRSLYNTLDPNLVENLDELIIVPEKPSVLAEERIFVYVPKVTFDTAGIAKFEATQFNIVNSKVSLNPKFVADLKTYLTAPPLKVSVETPVEEHYKMWYKVLNTVE